jgi:hypothetical protein
VLTFIVTASDSPQPVSFLLVGLVFLGLGLVLKRLVG